MRVHKTIAALALTTAITIHSQGARVINLLTDCSHDYSFNLSNASRNQNEIFPRINYLTSGRTIHKLDLEPINALAILVDGKLPFLPEDAPFLLDYVEQGGGLYLGVKFGGVHADSVSDFLAAFGLTETGPAAPAQWQPVDIDTQTDPHIVARPHTAAGSSWLTTRVSTGLRSTRRMNLRSSPCAD